MINTAYLSQSSGQSERTSSTVEGILPCFLVVPITAHRDSEEALGGHIIDHSSADHEEQNILRQITLVRKVKSETVDSSTTCVKQEGHPTPQHDTLQRTSLQQPSHSSEATVYTLAGLTAMAHKLRQEHEICTQDLANAQVSLQVMAECNAQMGTHIITLLNSITAWAVNVQAESNLLQHLCNVLAQLPPLNDNLSE
ncbi:hypothetical protein EMCG_01683 [[Emmonsia] crescens]|uniref:Uncharacterized protein n=1 Tax=[Emmonsia] crescens TaxID=73230 RepID=A0A0G2I0B6_9EURO|nr:hypothetical protein EMCG_01683 [Emmonsia crescens UAMH 3008]